jgi:hypothetical protein
MEQKYSSERSVAFQHAVWHSLPEDRTLHNHGYENLKRLEQIMYA